MFDTINLIKLVGDKIIMPTYYEKGESVKPFVSSMLSVFPTHSYLDDDFDGEKDGENQIRLVDNICILCKHNNQSLRGDKLQNSSKDSLSFNNLEITCIAEEGLSKTMKPQLRTMRNNTKLSNNLLPVICIIKRRNLKTVKPGKHLYKIH